MVTLFLVKDLNLQTGSGDGSLIHLLLEQCRFINICARVGQKWSFRSKSVKNLIQKSKNEH